MNRINSLLNTFRAGLCASRRTVCSVLMLATTLPVISTGCDLEIHDTEQGQGVIDSNRERCSIAQEAADGLEYQINANAHDGSKYRQFLITMNNLEFGLCTAAQVRDEDEPTIIRMNATGFEERFGLTLPRTGVDVSGDITTHDCPADGVSLSNAFVECLDDDRNNTRFIVTAPHGGMIEEYTDTQAEYVRDALRAAEEDVTLWTAKGWHQNGAKTHWHITSGDIGTQSFTKLGSVADRGFQYAVSFHGRGGFENESIVWIGGNAAPALKQLMKQNIEASAMGVTVNLVNQGALAGTSQDNFVNWLTVNGTGGIQLEQTSDARELHGDDIAQGVVNAIQAFN